MIFIVYEDNGYYIIYYTLGNIIFNSTYTIFDKRLFLKCTNSHTKEYKLYNKLLDKISLEIELLVSDPSRKDEPAPVSISHISIPPIQNNSSTCSSLPSLSYKSTSSLPTPRSKKLIVEIEEANNIDFDVETQLYSSQ